MSNTFAVAEHLDETRGTELVGDNEGKFHPRTGHEGPEWEKRYGSTLSLTSALHGLGGQGHTQPLYPPGKIRYP